MVQKIHKLQMLMLLAAFGFSFTFIPGRGVILLAIFASSAFFYALFTSQLFPKEDEDTRLVPKPSILGLGIALTLVGALFKMMRWLFCDSILLGGFVAVGIGTFLLERKKDSPKAMYRFAFVWFIIAGLATLPYFWLQHDCIRYREYPQLVAAFKSVYGSQQDKAEAAYKAAKNQENKERFLVYVADPLRPGAPERYSAMHWATDSLYAQGGQAVIVYSRHLGGLIYDDIYLDDNYSQEEGAIAFSGGLGSSKLAEILSGSLCEWIGDSLPTEAHQVHVWSDVDDEQYWRGVVVVSAINKLFLDGADCVKELNVSADSLDSFSESWANSIPLIIH